MPRKGQNYRPEKSLKGVEESSLKELHSSDNLKIKESMVGVLEPPGRLPVDVPPLRVNLKRLLSVREVSPHEDGDQDDRSENGATNKDPQLLKQRKKRMKRKARLEREEAIRLAEERQLQDERPPSTSEEFERQLLASPSSSFLWIKYMAHLLALVEVDKARAVADRALSTINYREEKEKMNVWVAYLNLENMYGSPPKEAVLKLFQRALQQTEPKALHLALLGIFERSEQHDMAEELLRSMVKKFKTSAKVWLRNVEHLLRREDEESAQKIINRALLSLPPRKHIKLISKAALLCFRAGSHERARTLMEGILRNYPKRLDLWSVYLDQEIRLGDMSAIRALFERASCVPFPPKKMKAILKKHLDFESRHGDEEHAKLVQAKAFAYVKDRLGMDPAG